MSKVVLIIVEILKFRLKLYSCFFDFEKGN